MLVFMVKSIIDECWHDVAFVLKQAWQETNSDKGRSIDLHGISPKLSYGSAWEETQALAKAHWISRIWIFFLFFL